MKNTIIQLFSIFIMFTVVQNIPAQLPLSEIEPAPDGLYNGRLSNQDFFQQADVIFQGDRVSVKTYTNADTSHFWRSVIIDVKHVLKGADKISEGNIEFIIQDGYLMDTIDVLGRKEYIAVDGIMGHGGYELSPGGIFFCTLSDRSLRPQGTNPSVVPLQDSRYAGLNINPQQLKNRGFLVYGLHDLYFKSLEDFYDYAAQYEGISIPEYLKKNIQRINSYENLEDFMDAQQELVKIAQQNKVNKNHRQNPTLTWTIRNQRITGDDPAYFEFDVAIQSSQPTYYANSIGRLDFNTSVFGTNLADNGKIELILNSDEFSPTN